MPEPAVRKALLACLVACLVAGIGVPSAMAFPPGQGPGGPVLVVANPSDAFSRYYAEILQGEGLNEFDVVDLGALTAAQLGSHQVIVLAQTGLTDAQVSALSAWVQGGGNLIAMRPDDKLDALLGLGSDAGDLSQGYIAVDTGSPPGAGITGATMQFHGTADLHTLAAETRAVAMLYSNATTPTSQPAVTLRSVGSSGGQAAAFTYDLARSVVWTRQGNPAWAGQKRDGQTGPIRSDDLFFGAATGDPQPDWVNLDKVAIPQADEQQRLLANLITLMESDRTPLPRFWYLPRGLRAAVILTGDDHAKGGTAGQFATYLADSPAGCAVADWECVRSTSYVYPSTPITDAQIAAWQDAGFEIALHPTTNCADFTRASLRQNWSDQLSQFRANFPSATPPRTSRTHCVAWSDWASEPIVERENGVRMDLNYYYWPGAWVQNRPGMFTGSGFPQRFADSDGSLIDVYQATTQMTDESNIDVALHVKTLLDHALGPQGYYGTFAANMHTDNPDNPGADAIVSEATSRGVPVISAAQMLTWLDGRNGSSFSGLSFTSNQLSFSIQPGAGAAGLRAMLPVNGPTGRLNGLFRGGAAVPVSFETIKGVEYATFDAVGGSYVATFGSPPPPPPPAGGGTPPPGPTATPRSPSPTAVPPSVTALAPAPRAAVSPRRVRQSLGGAVRLRVACPTGVTSCRVTLTLKVGQRTIGRTALTVRGGASRLATVKLSAWARGRLALHRTLTATAVALSRDPAGRGVTTRTRIQLLAPKRNGR